MSNVIDFSWYRTALEADRTTQEIRLELAAQIEAGQSVNLFGLSAKEVTKHVKNMKRMILIWATLDDDFQRIVGAEAESVGRDLSADEIITLLERNSADALWLRLSCI